MSKQTYQINDRVYVPGLGENGTIIAIENTLDGVVYTVKFDDDSVTPCHEDELEPPR